MHDTRTFNNSPSGKHNGIFVISWLYPRRAQNTIQGLRIYDDANAFDMHFKLGADIKYTFYHNTHANA